ncbi:MAG: hypothetical protein AAF517_22930 [Planctomycetota bacterium]
MLRSIRLWAVGALSLVSVTSLWAQCVPPAGPYRMWIDPANQSAVACPGTTITFDIVVSGGAQSISGAGFNIEMGVPGTITSVVPGFNPAGGGFITHVDPTGTKLAGFAIRSPTVAPLTTVATVTYALQTVSTPGTFQILFNGTLALPGGMVPVNHVVEASSGCDVVAPILGLGGGSVRITTCAGNFIRGDCNNNGQVAGLTGDIWFLLNSLFAGGPLPACDAACDADDDDIIDISDAIYLLNWMLLNGAPPPPPTPGFGLASCGPDPTPGLSCAAGICP